MSAAGETGALATIAVEDPPAETSLHAIDHGLRGYNRRFFDRGTTTTLCATVRDADGTIVGGCIFHLRWHWLEIADLWLDDAWRGRGLGRALLASVEAEAVRRGCTKSRLDTASFQARPFYEKQGYVVFGTIADYPPGHAVHYMTKQLLPPR
jgi:GNAT superfamily N-acetyltransferase